MSQEKAIREKRMIGDLSDDDESKEIELADHPTKRQKTHSLTASSNGNESSETKPAPWELWNCDFCGDFEHYEVKGKLTMSISDIDDDSPYYKMDICQICHDKQMFIRPHLDPTGNVENACTLKDHEQISQWQSVAIRNKDLNNDSTTKQWQDAWWKRFGPKEERLDLQCPFQEKDECYNLGGKWDADKKTWYIPAGIHCAPFSKWMN